MKNVKIKNMVCGMCFAASIVAAMAGYIDVAIYLCLVAIFLDKLTPEE